MNKKEDEDIIVEEVRAIRNAYAQKFNYDLKAIVEDLRRGQAEEGKKVVNLEPNSAQEIRKAAA